MYLLDLQEQPLWLNIAVFAAAGIVVWIGGTHLTRALDAISERTGLGRLFVGMLLLGTITSLPEVANVISASSSGVPQLAVNNLLGSAAINVVLLAIADAFIGRDAVTSVVADPATLMLCTLCMLVLAVVAAAIAIGDIDVYGLGAWSITITVLSVAAFALAVGYGKRAPWVLREAPPGRRDDSILHESRRPMSALVGISVVAAAAIFLAGYTLSEAGDVIATKTGLGAGFVGFMLIGVSTSMPELSTIRESLKLRQHEMAFGQVLGTNFVNLSLFLLVDIIYREGPVINVLGRFEEFSALLGLVLIGVFLIGLLERRNARIFRMGYDSFAVIVLFIVGAALLYTIRKVG